MTKVTQTNPTRRSALRGISLTALAADLAVPALASTKPDDDADARLIRLCAEFDELQRQIDAHFEEPATIPWLGTRGMSERQHYSRFGMPKTN